MAPVQAEFGAALFSLALPLLSSLQIGSLITWGLQGVLCVQVYNYYLSFPKDPLHMKVLVYGSLILELVQTLMVTHDAYEVFAKGFGDITGLNDLHLLWFTLPILGGVVGLLCHLTFAYRICLLSESRITGGVIAALALCASVSAFAFGGKLFAAGILSELVKTKHIYLTCGMWNGSGALCDVMIASFMTYYLSRNHTGFRNTDYLITRIIRLTIETGVATGKRSLPEHCISID
ncbi:hypothetical protein BDZ97DRAFT_130065 [Flammula alnicola]|nr:hypothetical protein BDZ97DRAFT_130065 [Flammula alnicola]